MTLESDLKGALADHRRGRGDLAEPVYRKILAANPDHGETRHLLGILLLQKGETEAAEAEIRKALAADGSVAKYHNTLANILFPLDRLNEAEAALRQALALEEDFFEAWFNLGNVLRAKGRLLDAEEAYGRALALKPDHPGVHNNLGVVYRALDRAAEALAEYEKARGLAPDFPEAVHNVAVTLKEQGRPEEARRHFSHLMEIKPTDATRINMATVLPAMVESVEEIERIREDFADGLARLRDQPLSIDQPLEEIGALSHFFLAYHGLDDLPLNRALAETYRRAAPSLSLIAPHCADRRAWRPARRVKVGILSLFFKNHTIGKLMADLIVLLPRETLEIFVIGPRHGGQEAAAIRQAGDHFVPMVQVLEKDRETVAALGLDILFYADIGMHPLTYLMAFARLAPIQVTTWGHPVTSGIETMDYFLSAAELEGPEADADYSETLVRLRHPPTCIGKPETPRRLGRDHFGFAEGAHLYICPQSMFKLHPDFDFVLGEILRRDPLGEVVLIAGRDAWVEKLKRRQAKVIPDVANRIHFLDRLSLSEFLNLLRLGDVMLDPLHFSGGLTSLQGFSFGTPIVTLPARYMRGRVTYAYYRQMGLCEGIAESAEDYVERAVNLGTEPDRRRAFSQAIFQSNGSLYGNREVADDMAAFFVQAVDEARSA